MSAQETGPDGQTIDEATLTPQQVTERRWRLAVGSSSDTEDGLLSQTDRALMRALDALYGSGERQAGPAGSKKRRGGMGRSAPKIAAWMDELRSYFPASVVQVVQKDAFERLDLKQMLMEPEFLAAMEADVNLVADLVALRSVMPAKTKEVARELIAKIVAELIERLERKTAEALRGAVDKSRRTSRPRFSDIDWHRTINANLRHYQHAHKTIIPERLIGFQRQQRRMVDLDEVVLCVDQSGSMATSVVYASIFAAVMASLPVVQTKLIGFDTAILDLTEDLADPVDVLFGVQLGGGTDINQAVAYCAERIEKPTKSHFILITDLYEGGDATDLMRRVAALQRSGVNVIVLLALTDTGRPSYDETLARHIAALGIPVFACTPDQFPDMMATALRREDVHAWAATEDIKLVRSDEGEN